MARNHIVIIDGTQSRLDEGHETNAGQLYKMIDEARDPRQTLLWYHSGIQGHGFWDWVTIASGRGTNQIIRNAYAQLSSNYEAGDKIYLFGYSRGAYAVRSLAGLINRVGLLHKEDAIERFIKQAFVLYELERPSPSMQRFCDEHCHTHVEIEMIGVWDTVKALGINFPILSRLAPMATEFHDDKIGGDVKNGFHALSLDETRNAYAPVLWNALPDWQGHMEQVWFVGAHADIGGHVWRFPQARALSNIPLVWMCQKAQACGLALPDDWQDRFPCDINAPLYGTRRGIAKFFLFRSKRKLGQYVHEYLHETAAEKRPELREQLKVVK